MWGWVKIRSWHAVRTPTRAFDTYVTVCGKTAHGETLDVFPADEKSCETCLRIQARAPKEPA